MLNSKTFDAVCIYIKLKLLYVSLFVLGILSKLIQYVRAPFIQ
jgi:hypothetical protein